MASPFFFIQFTDDAFIDPRTGRGVTNTLAFDSTSSVTRSANDILTKNIVETGKEVADNYITAGQVISFAGVITDIKSATGANDKSTAQFLSDLQRLRLSKKPFDIICGDLADVFNIGGLGNFNLIRNCFFKNFSVNQNTTHGIGNQRSKSYNVTFTAQETRFGSRAVEGEITIPGVVIEKEVAKPVTKEASTTRFTVGPRPFIFGA